ncbi:MAG: hypothetical protein JWQ32_16 [Marmoricola sp.]|nr:hypothetical protein [Marmoricola sp.]
MGRRSRGGRIGFIFLLLVAVVGGIAVALTRGVTPFPTPEGCTAKVSGLLVSVDPDQGRNAALIAAIGVRRGLPARAVSIALATAYQESKIRNLTYGDLDSLGLFQQRTSQGWGSPSQILDPYYSINKFYSALERINGYETMQITVAAQRVQHSAYPSAYEPHAADARALASALTGYSPNGTFTCVVHQPSGTGTASNVTSSLTKAFGSVAAQRTGVRQDLAVQVSSGQDGNRRGWSLASYLVAYAGPLKIATVSFDGLIWHTGSASEKGWQKSSGASNTLVAVSLG